MDEPTYSVIVPVYRSEKTLTVLFDRVDSTFRNIDKTYELILVEDCGGDGSWEVMKALREKHPQVKIVRLTRNFGQHNALLCGFSMASGDFVISMDDDLQNPPEEIPKLIEAINSSTVDVVYGIPETRRHSMIRNMGSMVFFTLMSAIFRMDRRLSMSSFRIIRKEIVHHILNDMTPNPVIGVLLLKVTDRIETVTVSHHPRSQGESSYTTGKLVRHFLNGILYHSDLPLKTVFVLGIFCLLLSALLGVFYLVRNITGAIGVSGWTTLVLLMLFFSGIGMFSLGIVGEYLLRIIQEVKRSPQYIIRDKDL